MRVAKQGLPTTSFNEQWVRSVTLEAFLNVLSGRINGWSDENLKEAYYEVKGEEPKKKKKEGGE